MGEKHWRTVELTINGFTYPACYTEENIEELFVPFLQRLEDLRKRPGRRIIACVAAPPAVGKSPLVAFLVPGTGAILVLQPGGGALSDLIGNTATGAIAAGGALTGAILGGTFLPMVMLGIHQTLTPIHAELLARYGVTILLPVLAMAGAGQVGASFAVYCRTKNARLKKIIASALPVGILGVGEPLIYGVTLPLGKPFLGACIGGACGGAVQAAFGVGAATLGISGLPLAAATDNIPIYLLGLVCAYIGGFVATLVIGFDDPVETADDQPSPSERV